MLKASIVSYCKTMCLYLQLMKSPKNEIMITVRMSQEMRNDLKSLADKEDRKLAEFIRIKLKQLIAREKEKNPKP